jgi:SAM-dependent methyltransferase
MTNDRKFTEESNRFRESGDSHDLPQIAAWYSENVLSQELFNITGSKSFQELVLENIKVSRQTKKEYVVVSLGAGHGQIEKDLLDKVPQYSPGNTSFFAIDLFSPNDFAQSEVNGHLYTLTRISQDINEPNFPKNADMVIVHHALHHFVSLERIFESIYEILSANSGVLIISDMIGRNGHKRWPESLHAIRRIWNSIPEEKKYNHQFKRSWSHFENWDCSSEGFEGIRAEDILKPLYQYFDTQGALFWGGVLDPFVDRGFGHNFDPSNVEDLNIILKILSIENLMIENGYLTPTQLIGKFTPRGKPLKPSFTNLLISKKYSGELNFTVKKEIETLVNSHFPDSSFTTRSINFENIYFSKNLEPYMTIGWDKSDPTQIWGIGQDSAIEFDAQKGNISAIVLESYISKSAVLGRVRTLINNEVAIEQPLMNTTTIQLPCIPISRIVISFSFTKIDTPVNALDKRQISFCIQSMYFLKEGDATIVPSSRTRKMGFVLQPKLMQRLRIFSKYLPPKFRKFAKNAYIKIFR